MSSFTKTTFSGSSFTDNAGSSTVNRSSLDYDSNINAFNFNELILNDLILFNNNIGLIDSTGSIDNFTDFTNESETYFDEDYLLDADDVMFDGIIWHDNFTKKTISITNWTDIS
jgi:hypothetical protein